MPRLDINADMGESYGRWKLGDDAALMPFVTSANIACGFHAGDPHIMRDCVSLARQHNVGIGAHVGFADLEGFGRRRIDMTPDQFREQVIYQIGAMMGFAAAAGSRVEHVKPHSAMYKLCMDSPKHAESLVQAVYDVDPHIILIHSSENTRAAAKRIGLAHVVEGFIDLEYDSDGNYVPEWPKRSWSPERVANRAVQLATQGTITYRDGTTVPLPAQSVCIHGDADNAADIGRAVNHALFAAGVTLTSVRQMIAGGQS